MATSSTSQQPPPMSATTTTTMTTQPPRMTASFPFMYGSAASYLQNAAETENGATHRWTFYVRGLNGQDLSPVVSKVIFMLHPTCTVPVVECTKYPFETTQTGWGEFNAGIKIYFTGTNAYVTVHHLLRFTPDGSANPLYDGTWVVKESYDEVIFKDPSPDLLQRLKLVSESPAVAHALTPYWPNTLPVEDHLRAIMKADAWVKKEIVRLVTELGKADVEIERQKKVRMAAAGASTTTALPSSAVVGAGITSATTTSTTTTSTVITL